QYCITVRVAATTVGPQPQKLADFRDFPEFWGLRFGAAPGYIPHACRGPAKPRSVFPPVPWHGSFAERGISEHGNTRKLLTTVRDTRGAAIPRRRRHSVVHRMCAAETFLHKKSTSFRQTS